jgi:hypothetical protein
MLDCALMHCIDCVAFFPGVCFFTVDPETASEFDINTDQCASVEKQGKRNLLMYL